ncbi:MAG TPA: hypothetical protein VFA18_00215 [Gemmataceae bacterium]|nr:hypothetical protein [Gemmataceae bacterium]
MNSATKIFLVILRLAIGWQFLFEGAEKLYTVYSPTQDTKPYTSTGFLQQATGPFRDQIVAQVGDPDKTALDRLQPETITAAWRAYYDQFAQHYALTADQRKRADALIDKQQKDLVEGKHMFKNAYPGRTVPLEETLAQRVADYRQVLAEVQEREGTKLRVFNHDVEQADLQLVKGQAADRRRELLAFVGDQTNAFKKSLDDLLTPDQKAKGAVPETPAPRAHWLDWDNLTWLRWLSAWTVGVLGAVMFLSNLGGILRHRARGDLGFFGRSVAWLWTLIGLALAATAAVYIYMHWRDYSRTEIMDWLSSWGLLLIGAALLLGLATRSAALAGAVFLVMLYLWWPPLPWVPLNPKAEGAVPFINKNMIELLALLVLATTRSGRWLGLDAIIQVFNPWRYRRVPPASVPAPRQPARHMVRV